MNTGAFKASAPSDLGGYEQLAGVDDRAAFWKPFTPLAKLSTQHYIDAGIEAAQKLIDQRIKAGELSLVCNLEPCRQMRAKRMREFSKAAKVAA